MSEGTRPRVRVSVGAVRARLLTIAGAALAAAVPLSGCGSSGSSTAGGSSTAASSAKPQLVVSAASSLKGAFTAYGRTFGAARVRLSFAGSDMLAAQIRQGVTPDVFASANTKLPLQLHSEGLVGTPTVFAANRLVLAVGASGAYTRTVLGRLSATQAHAILANVRSNEPDVAGIVGKLSQGAVDAGFVYVTDVKGSGGKLRAIELPARLQPRVAYGVTIAAHAKHPREAQAFVTGLLHGDGAQALHAAGFEPPPLR